MKNTVVYIIGLPGTGKLSVAKELCKKKQIKLIDNHLISNIIFSISDDINNDKHLDFRTKIRNIALDAVADIAKPEENFILTNVLYKNSVDWYSPVEKMAMKRNAKFVPIELVCSRDENMKRIQSEGRSAQYKATDVKVVDEASSLGLWEFQHPNKLVLDNTNLSISEAADVIIKHINNINAKLIRKNKENNISK